MPREVLVAWAGRHQRDPWDQLCGSYRRRIARQVSLRELPVMARSGKQGRARRGEEGEALLRALPDPCWTVAVDRRGRMRSSEEVARWLGRRLDEWPHPIAFLLGSDLGLSSAIRREAREDWSFGPLTLPHELARLVLYEQIYRALSIRAGIKYHRQSL